MPITEANESRRRSSVRRPSIAADKLQGLVSSRLQQQQQQQRQSVSNSCLVLQRLTVVSLSLADILYCTQERWRLPYRVYWRWGESSLMVHELGRDVIGGQAPRLNQERGAAQGDIQLTCQSYLLSSHCRTSTL